MWDWVLRKSEDLLPNMQWPLWQSHSSIQWIGTGRSQLRRGTYHAKLHNTCRGAGVRSILNSRRIDDARVLLKVWSVKWENIIHELPSQIESSNYLVISLFLAFLCETITKKLCPLVTPIWPPNLKKTTLWWDLTKTVSQKCLKQR